MNANNNPNDKREIMPLIRAYVTKKYQSFESIFEFHKGTWLVLYVLISYTLFYFIECNMIGHQKRDVFKDHLDTINTIVAIVGSLVTILTTLSGTLISQISTEKTRSIIDKFFVNHPDYKKTKQYSYRLVALCLFLMLFNPFFYVPIFASSFLLLFYLAKLSYHFYHLVELIEQLILDWRATLRKHNWDQIITNLLQ